MGCLKKSTDRNHQHVFPIVNAMVGHAVNELAEENVQITCAAGCAHCCHLFIEVSWEEASEIVFWIADQPEAKQKIFINKIIENAKAAREVISRHNNASHLLTAFRGDKETPDKLFDAYFYDQVIPCAFLAENKTCSAYEARPISCRLHLVASDPENCSRASDEDADYDIPDRIEELKEEVAPVNAAVEKDGRWGHFGIMVEAVLIEQGLISEQKNLLTTQECCNA